MHECWQPEIITPWININHCGLDAGLHDEDIGHHRLYNLKGLQANYTLWALYIKYFFICDVIKEGIVLIMYI
jgi:hypothetical protein